MSTTKAFLVAALTVTAVCGSVAFAGAPMGPPMALLGEGRWAIDGEYGLEQTDLEAYGICTERFDTVFIDRYAQIFEIEDLQTNMFFLSVAYGVCDNWDIFARVGMADAQDDIVVYDPEDPGEEPGRFGFDGNFGFAWGAGTRATFCRSGPWSFGGLTQITWFNPGSSNFTLTDPAGADEPLVGDVDIDYWQAQFSLAAVYQMGALYVWGGPFLQFVEGNMDVGAVATIPEVGSQFVSCSSDLEETSQIGAHFGANWEANERWNVWVEGQLTGDSWLLGVGTMIKLGEPYGM